MNKVRVAVNGYGVIGKRVADAVALQEDMALAGVADVVHDYRLQVAAQRAFPIYAATAEAAQSMRAAGLPVAAIWPTCSPTRTSWSIAHPRKSPRSTRGRTTLPV